MSGAIAVIHGEILQVRVHLRDGRPGAALIAWGESQRMLGLVLGGRGPSAETDVVVVLLSDLGAQLRRLIEPGARA